MHASTEYIDDKECTALEGVHKSYMDAIEEASRWVSTDNLRDLFITLLVSGTLESPEVLWNNCWQLLSNNYAYNPAELLKESGHMLSEERNKAHALFEVEKILCNRGHSLQEYKSLTSPNWAYLSDTNNLMIQEELNYDKIALATEHFRMLSNLTKEQYGVYNTIMAAFDSCKDGIFFIYGGGGTGKTFLCRTISTAIRSRGKIVLNVASTSVTASFLPGGRNAHSRFHIPLNLDEDSVCNIKQGSQLAELIQRTSVIIWDDATSTNKYCIEALDRTMRDITKGYGSSGGKRPFGGKIIVFSGDFRQNLPNIPHGTRNEIVSASLNASYLWSYVKILKLTKNIRLGFFPGHQQSEEIRYFSYWISSIGDGDIGYPNEGIAEIKIPKDLLVIHTSNPVKSIVDSTYPNFHDEERSVSYLKDRVILASTLEDVEMVNDYMIGLNEVEMKMYFSTYLGCASYGSVFDILNKLPSHILKLKVGVPVMLMHNIDPSIGLCMGTKLIVTRLGEHVIEANVISGVNAGKSFLIPKLSTMLNDMRLPFPIERLQFPLKVCYATTINMSQGHTYKNVGIYLRKPVIAHGQLYAAVSKVSNRNGLKFVICDDNGHPSDTTINVVYKEVFMNI